MSTEVPIPDTASAAAGPMALTTGAPMMYPISIAELFIDPIVERALGFTPSATVPTTMIRSAAT
ncbi:hypothetical protein [Corynebacterium sp. LaCa142]|uniref:hypothetical protein n=1 Tax=Corynebacterium sp. LaCa142 TaxID=3391425 RepID=UPI003989E850